MCTVNFLSFFFFNDTATTEIYTLSLHDALPISSRAGTESRAPHLYVMVAACAAIVYLGALWNRFAFDDVAIVVMTPLVGHLSGLWKAFAAPYWTPDLGGSMYRPLTIAAFALDRAVDGAAWLHAVNLAWHAAASVAVAALARRLTNNAGALADRKSTRLNSSHGYISYAVFCL